ncbi:MAG: aldo/keto reductase [Solirubrobacteraceae bacterium]|jgi:aryl-alcohol dehydrogenase-like predicted oxidoreductase
MTGAGTLSLGDLEVDRLGFGAMRITGPGIWGPPTQPPDGPDGALALLRRAVELGVNFFDTADSYGPNVSEELIAAALAPYDGLLVATKGGLTRPGPNVWHADGRPEHLREALEGSLRRLKLERIDLYQFHRPDPKVPLEESLGALVEARAQGKIRHIGLSNVSLDELERALAMTEIVSVQNRYSALDRKSQEVLDACARHGIAFIPWFPLAAGEATTDTGALEHVARGHDASAGQIALAWLLATSPVMLPIPGTSRIEHLEQNVAAAAIRLSEADLEALSPGAA